MVFERGRLQFCSCHQFLEHRVAVRGNNPPLPSSRESSSDALPRVGNALRPQGELDQLAVPVETQSLIFNFSFCKASLQSRELKKMVIF